MWANFTKKTGRKFQMAESASMSAWVLRKFLFIGFFVILVILIGTLIVFPKGEKCMETVRYINEVREVLVTNKPETTTINPPPTEIPSLHMNLTTRKTLLHIEGLDLYLYSAFLDDRYHENIIRIFGLQKKDAELPHFSCRWRKNAEPHLEVKAKKVFVDASWPTWSHYYAVNYDCNFKKSAEPEEIELISNDGIFTFTMPVERTVKLKKRKLLGLCIKPVTGGFITSRLIEWFEAHRAAGIKDILLYTTDVLGAAQYVVQYYKDLGLVRTLPFPYLMSILQMVDTTEMEGHVRYAVYQQVYLIAMQDCLYRFYGSYEHLLFLDLDEVMFPSPPHKDLEAMVTHLRKYYLTAGGFIFMTAWHFEDYGLTNDSSVPHFMYIARYPRATTPFENQPKSIIVTDRAISLNFHSVLDVSDGRFSNEVVPYEDVGYIHHFRGLCTIKFEDHRCTDFEKNVRYDPVLPTYVETLVKNTRKVKEKLLLN